MDPESIANEIIDLYIVYGSSDYIGENITQISHAIQSAKIAEKYLGTDGYIGAFLHDIGHLIGLRDGNVTMDNYGTFDHEIIGATYLRKHNFPDRIVKMVLNHVEAKKELLVINDSYLNALSEASRQTLKFQTIDREISCDDMKDALIMRLCEDGAKKNIDLAENDIHKYLDELKIKIIKCLE